MELQQGFVLTRHWHDTPEGTCVEFWLATDQGPRQLRLAVQESVAFIPEIYAAHARALLRMSRALSSSHCVYVTSSSVRYLACIVASIAS